MRISVVTVCFNAAATIGATLSSVAIQDHVDLEHIIVDGGSTDGTLEIVSRFPHVSRVISEPDEGLYDAMNKGAAAATGEFIGWLNADDILNGAHAISTVAAAAKADKDIVAASITMVDHDDLSRVIRHYSSQGFQLDWLRYGYAVPHPGFYIRRASFVELGGYDLRFPLAADFDLIARAMYTERLSYQTLSDVIVRMRMGGRSFGLKAALQMLEEVYQSCRKNGVPTNRIIMLYRYLHKAMQYFRPRPSPSAN